MLAFSGTKALIEEVKRFSARKLQEAALQATQSPIHRKLLDHVLAKNNIKLADETTGAMVTEPSAPNRSLRRFRRRLPTANLSRWRPDDARHPNTIDDNPAAAGDLRVPAHTASRAYDAGSGQLQPRIQSRPPGRALGNRLVSGSGHRRETREGFCQRMRRPILFGTAGNVYRERPELFTNLEMAKRAAEVELGKRLNRPVHIRPQVELYCPCKVPFYDYLESDVEFARARYDAQTDSIRSVPDGRCLLSWPKNDLLVSSVPQAGRRSPHSGGLPLANDLLQGAPRVPQN